MHSAWLTYFYNLIILYLLAPLIQFHLVFLNSKENFYKRDCGLIVDFGYINLQVNRNPYIHALFYILCSDFGPDSFICFIVICCGVF